MEVRPDVSDLLEMIQTGSAEAALAGFLQKVSDRNFASFIEEVAGELAAWKNRSSPGAPEFSQSLVEKHSQRVLNLLASVASGLKKQFERDKLSPLVIAKLDQLVEADGRESNGVSRSTTETLERAKQEVVKAITAELRKPKPDAQRIALLIGGDMGVRLVTQSVIQPTLLSFLNN